MLPLKNASFDPLVHSARAAQQHRRPTMPTLLHPWPPAPCPTRTSHVALHLLAPHPRLKLPVVHVSEPCRVRHAPLLPIPHTAAAALPLHAAGAAAKGSAAVGLRLGSSCLGLQVCTRADRECGNEGRGRSCVKLAAGLPCRRPGLVAHAGSPSAQATLPCTPSLGPTKLTLAATHSGCHPHWLPNLYPGPGSSASKVHPWVLQAVVITHKFVTAQITPAHPRTPAARCQRQRCRRCRGRGLRCPHPAHPCRHPVCVAHAPSGR